MDLRQERLLFQRTHRGALRTRERNLTEKRMLDNYLWKLELKSKKEETVIAKKIKHICNEVYKQDMLQDLEEEDDGSDKEFEEVSVMDIKSEAPARAIQSARVPRGHAGGTRSQSAPLMISSSREGKGKDVLARADSAAVRWKHNRNKASDVPVFCKFEEWQRPCTQFPCVRPSHYNNIGFQVNPSAKNAMDRFCTSTQNSARAREQLLNDLEMHSVRRPQRSISDRCQLKEKALHKNMADQKLRSQLAKPPDWCTNYGTPTPRRKFLRVARPMSGSADLAGL